MSGICAGIIPESQHGRSFVDALVLEADSSGEYTAHGPAAEGNSVCAGHDGGRQHQEEQKQKPGGENAHETLRFGIERRVGQANLVEEYSDSSVGVNKFLRLAECVLGVLMLNDAGMAILRR
jgi:hypothetical protein